MLAAMTRLAIPFGLLMLASCSAHGIAQENVAPRYGHDAPPQKPRSMARQHKEWEAEAGALREQVERVLKQLNTLQESIEKARPVPKDDSGM